ncbi:MAG: hypothetical protein MI784_12580 [Cytophagales bacterium]|nr:hypothetical protein [Cytophagales bacterium]
MNNLTAIAALLQKQLQKTGGSIQLNSSILPESQLSSIQNAFMLDKNAPLTLEGLKSIPAAENGQLAVQGGTASILNVHNVPVELVFRTAGNQINLLISASMSADWTFSESFSGLTGYPFQSSSIKNACFVYSSVSLKAFSPWSHDSSVKVPLSQGLNFTSELDFADFSPLLSLLGKILKVNASYPFYGPIKPNQGKPSGTLVAPIGNSDFDLGYSPYDFSLSDPSFLTQISEPNANLPSVSLYLQAVSSLGMTCRLLLPDTDDGIFTLDASPKSGNTIGLSEIIARLPGGEGFSSYIPAELESLADSITLKDYSMSFSPAKKAVTDIKILVSLYSWEIIPNILQTKSLDLTADLQFKNNELNETDVSISGSASVLPTVFSQPFQLSATVSESEGKWKLNSINCKSTNSVLLGRLTYRLLGSNTLIPEVLQYIAFTDIALTVDPSKGSYSFSGSAADSLPFIGTQINNLKFDVNPGSRERTVVLNGKLVIAEQTISLSTDFAASSKSGKKASLRGSWKAAGKALTINDLAEGLKLEQSLPKLPEALDPSFTELNFLYEWDNSQLVIGANTSIGKSTLVVCKAQKTKTWEYYFAIASPYSYSLSDLPILDDTLPSALKLSAALQQVNIASAPLIDSKTITSLNALINSSHPGNPLLPASGIQDQLVLALKLSFGELTQTAYLEIKEFSTSENPSKVVTKVAQPASSDAVQSADGTLWYKLQRSFGPINVQKIGLRYSNNTLWFLLDASLAASGFDLTVIGLMMGISLNESPPAAKFNIEGLGAAYSNSMLNIDGILGKMPDTPDGYEGTAKVLLSDFALSVMGEYAKSPGKSSFPSMFLFVDVEHPLGGPGCCFVTGLCGGFGYNSLLRFPSAKDLYQFPLLASLNEPGSPSLPEMWNSLNSWISPEAKGLWIAAGFNFTTYEIVQSTAMLLAELSSVSCYSIIGTSVAQFPKDGDKTYAYIELALDAFVMPQEGEAAFMSSLSPNSYVLDKDCHLTGGFAFCYWFGESPQAGDYVLTLGGYSPFYSPPSYYPQEPRLRFKWSPDHSVSISGDAYFALTPQAIMAGGEINAVYHHHDLKAWFDAHANIVVWYNPFHFIADIGVKVGASYHVHFWFVSKTFSVELGADLTLWGPRTGGKVKIHWWVISFTVDFGASISGSKKLKKQRWDEFQKLLPASEHAIQIVPAQGLMTQPVKAKTSASVWNVRADRFQFKVKSAVPISQVNFENSNFPADGNNGSLLNIRPMQIKNTVSEISITINKNTEDSKAAEDAQVWTADCIQESVPSALWGEGDSMASLSGDSLVPNQLTGLQISAPSPELSKNGNAINVSMQNLVDFSIDPPGANPLTTVNASSGSKMLPKKNNPSLPKIEQAMSSEVLNTRTEIFKDLRKIGFKKIKNDPLTTFAKESPYLFSDSPFLT